MEVAIKLFLLLSTVLGASVLVSTAIFCVCLTVACVQHARRRR